MSSPLISIVMPAYRCKDTIAESVESVLAQTYENWELVISIDDAEDYAQELFANGLGDPRIKFVFTDGIETGSSNARNIGVEAAASQFIAVLDADDLFAPNKLAIVVPQLKKSAHLFLPGCK